MRWSTSLLIVLVAHACSGGEAAETSGPTQASQPAPADSVGDPALLKLVEDHVDAFFIYDPGVLRAAASPPGQMYRQIAYDILNYEVLGAVTCEAETVVRPSCSFTGEHDVSRLLGFEYGETWLFLTPSGDVTVVNRPYSDETESAYSPFRVWMSENEMELTSEGGPCGGYPFEGAAECAAAELAAAMEYVESHDYTAP